LAYNKAGGKVLAGLVRRRKAEQELFNTGDLTEELVIKTVKDVQLWLNRDFRSGLTLDGLYGDNTRKALVKALQKTLGVTADGIYGAKTEAAVKTLKIGSKGTLVQILQCFMICHKRKNTADGIFGEATKAAVKEVQALYKLKADGVAGKLTFQAICS
jgi:peptidoglycan hydrolase-like protein with peptidoglycan-binding domain